MRRWLWVLPALASLVITARLLVLASAIDRQAQTDEAQPADVIVVLGAAEYHGKPSPVLKARLDHALELYQRKLAPRILTTGGAGGDPHWTESEVGRLYLSKHGVPVEAIILEPEGSSTAESAVAAAQILRRMNLQSCIVVSDGYHIYRAKKMLQDQGIVAYGSPRPSQPQSEYRQRLLLLRESVGYSLWSAGIRR